MRRKRRGRSATEYFLAALGLALIALVAVLIATSGSCRFRMSPEIGEQPRAPRATPTVSP